jgi:hypothetical protein
VSAGWITSAAIVGLLVSTVIYAWQRRLEHQFLLQKEKRELFAEILRVADALFRDLIDGKMDDYAVYLLRNENSRQADHIMSILKLYESAGVFFAFRELRSQLKHEVDRGVRRGLSPEELLSDIQEKRSFLDDEMRRDLGATAVLFPWLIKPRFRFSPNSDFVEKIKQENGTN